MTCAETRDQLPLLLYGDLAGDQRAAAESHLGQCAACRRELAALSDMRRLLDEPAADAIAVDLVEVFREESRRRERVVRRWRSVALAGVAAALALLAVRVEIRMDGRQMVVRWGRNEPVAQRAEVLPAPVAVREDLAPSTKVADQLDALSERVKVLNELVRALAANVDGGDRDRSEELVKVRQELAAVQELYHKRFSETERDVSALYIAHFGPRIPGANP